LMSIALGKRGRDVAGSPQMQFNEVNCSPHRCGLLESPNLKRTRAHAPPAAEESGSSSSFACESARNAGASAAADITSALRNRVDPISGEPLFTLEQVKDIVRRAVDEKERQIRLEYDGILQQKLQEQYQAFAKFNEDYISRTLKSRDLGYIA
ncbi:MAG: hypothetical protein SGPRY_011407, partial [Prymnesium sp.]